MGLLIRRATLVTALDRWSGDLYCRDGRIAAIGEALEAAAGDEVLDADGLLVMPGGVDPHVHLSLPVAGTVSADDFESGTTAALAGGTTTVLDFVHPERGQDLLAALADRRREAELAVVDYGFHMAVTWWGERTAEWIGRCVAEEGIPFNVFLDQDSAVAEEYQIIGVPTFFFVNPEGTVMAVEHFLPDDYGEILLGLAA